MFYDMLRACAGEAVQVITATEEIKGVLLAVVEDGMIICNAHQNPHEEIIVRVSAILYVRILHGK